MPKHVFTIPPLPPQQPNRSLAVRFQYILGWHKKAVFRQEVVLELAHNPKRGAIGVDRILPYPIVDLAAQHKGAIDVIP